MGPAGAAGEAKSFEGWYPTTSASKGEGRVGRGEGREQGLRLASV